MQGLFWIQTCSELIFNCFILKYQITLWWSKANSTRFNWWSQTLRTCTPRIPNMMKNVQQIRTMFPIGRSDDNKVWTTSLRPGARLMTLSTTSLTPLARQWNNKWTYLYGCSVICYSVTLSIQVASAQITCYCFLAAFNSLWIVLFVLCSVLRWHWTLLIYLLTYLLIYLLYKRINSTVLFHRPDSLACDLM